MSDDSAYFEAELQYQRQRNAEASQDAEARLRDRRALVGIDIPPAAMTPDVLALLARRVVDVLRRWGNVRLAQQYEAAWADASQHAERLTALVNALRGQPTFTAEEWQQLDATRAASAIALEVPNRSRRMADCSRRVLIASYHRIRCL